jgi:uncharacterized membrane protein YedE/YeeE
MGKNIVAVVSGLMFGLGLGISQMVNPGKVLAFLDVSDGWDPSLAFVMGGALAITIFSFKFILGGARPVFGTNFNLPGRTAVDLQLVSGASIFGIGWGLVGLCPGPAIAALAYGRPESLVFLAAMFAGFFIEKINPIGSMADHA